MEYNFTHKQGKTFKAVNFALSGTPTLPEIDTVKMQLRKECGGLIFYEMLMTVVDPVAGLFKINEQIINISEFSYLYDIQIVFVGGRVENEWLEGSFNIKCKITN